MSIERLQNDEFPPKPWNVPAVKVPGPIIFLAGQTAKGDIKTATQTSLDNLAKVAAIGGSSPEKFVKVNVWLKDMGDFNAMNEVYIKFFGCNPPPRSCMQVGKLPGFDEVVIEIEAIAQAEGG
ncbi:hypothetical protein I203_105473 [Kwoniella mangroviensis CBS 8507]|uniref:uncharacterized protein n=1 Tax=Kwoniella mangroviensis CBS 8507 TaxID=1296122 RepID=UPI00080D7F0F|nr:uncharacterized protein I203_01284 [Kwoniella mangroviensis CBS 8507]OCF69427.1 hypothetical protein I203_01284 [Kwoniella mangroviensis CBS 8507]